MLWKDGTLRLTYDTKIIAIGYTSVNPELNTVIKIRIEEAVKKITMLKASYNVEEIINEISKEMID